MLIFEEIKGLKRDYDLTLLDYQQSQTIGLYQDGNIDINQEKKNIADLETKLKRLETIKEQLDDAKRKVIEASAISYEEANRFFSQVIGNPWENLVGIETIQDTDYLILYPDDSEEHDVILGKKAEDGLFYLYFENEEDQSLESFLDYNSYSKGLNKLMSLIEFYIGRKIEVPNEVDSLDEYLSKYSFGEFEKGDFDPISDNTYSMEEYEIVDESLNDYYYSIHEQASRKHALRRKATIFSKIAKQKTFQIRTRKKVDEKANKYPRKYGRIRTRYDITSEME